MYCYRSYRTQPKNLLSIIILISVVHLFGYSIAEGQEFFILETIGKKQILCQLNRKDKITLGYMNRLQKFRPLRKFLRKRAARLRLIKGGKRARKFRSTWKNHQTRLSETCRKAFDLDSTPSPTPSPSPVAEEEYLYLSTGFSIDRVNLSTGDHLENILQREDIGIGSPRSLAFNPDTNTLYWTDYERSQIAAKNLTSSNISVIADVQRPSALTLSEEGELFVTTGEGKLFRINPSSGESQLVIDSLPSGSLADIQITPSGNELLMLSSRTLYSYNFNTAQLSLLGSLPYSAHSMAVDPTTGDIYVLMWSGYPYNVLKISPDGSNTTEIVFSPTSTGVQYQIRFRASDQSLIITGYRDVSIHQLDGTRIASYQLDEVRFWPELLAVNPTDNTIYISGVYPSNVFSFDTATEELTTIVPSRAEISDLEVHNSKADLYFRDRGQAKIFRAGISGESETALLDITTGSSASGGITLSDEDLLWDQGGKLYRANLDGSFQASIALTTGSSFQGGNSYFKFHDSSQSLIWDRRLSSDSQEVVQIHFGGSSSFTPVFDADLSIRETIYSENSPNMYILGSQIGSGRIDTLYRLQFPSLQMEELISDLKNPQGIALSADEGTLYWSDDELDKVFALDLISLITREVISLPGARLRGLTVETLQIPASQ